MATASTDQGGSTATVITAGTGTAGIIAIFAVGGTTAGKLGEVM